MNYSFLEFLGLLGAVGLFLYGMKIMSEGLQKIAGDRLRNVLGVMTRNRLAGTITGFLITALIQSSSASIVLVVSFVNAGLMTLAQSMAVIFGANVGTTFTAWIIALFGFKVDISAFAVPLMAFAVPLLFSKKGRTKSTGEFIIGFALLFLGLSMISNYVPDLQQNPEMFSFLQRYASLGFRSVLIFTLVGLLVTMVIQSSAATFAICLIMFSKGWIDFNLACAIVLGSAVGTTITPILASLSGNVAAKRTAMGHLLFNVLGTIWCLSLFYPFVSMITSICESIGQGNPNELFSFVSDIHKTDPDVYNNLFRNTLPEDHPAQSRLSQATTAIMAMQVSASFGLSIFYTIYKLINLSIMIWFTKLYVKIVEWIIPSRRREEPSEFQLKFISAGLLSSAELNITQAEKEMVVYAQRVDKMLGMAREITSNITDTDEFSKQFSKLEKFEEISDRMELEIANFLTMVAEGRLSNEGKRKIAGLISIDSEIESIADSCYSVGRTIMRKQQSGVEFNEAIRKNIESMFDVVGKAMSGIIKLLEDIEAVTDGALIGSYDKEREINNLRNILRTANVENINNKVYEYQAGIFYMDIVSELERIGDHIINIADTMKSQFVIR